MAIPDDPGAKTLARTAKHQEELNKLGRSWFAQAREESEREAAEFEVWRKEHRKWSVFEKRPRPGGDFDSPSDE
jgi:hypothetical protein